MGRPRPPLRERRAGAARAGRVQGQGQRVLHARGLHQHAQPRRFGSHARGRAATGSGGWSTASARRRRSGSTIRCSSRTARSSSTGTPSRSCSREGLLDDMFAAYCACSNAWPPTPRGWRAPTPCGRPARAARAARRVQRAPAAPRARPSCCTSCSPRRRGASRTAARSSRRSGTLTYAELGRGSRSTRPTGCGEHGRAARTSSWRW